MSGGSAEVAGYLTAAMSAEGPCCRLSLLASECHNNNGRRRGGVGRFLGRRYAKNRFLAAERRRKNNVKMSQICDAKKHTRADSDEVKSPHFIVLIIAPKSSVVSTHTRERNMVLNCRCCFQWVQSERASTTNHEEGASANDVCCVTVFLCYSCKAMHKSL